MNKNFLVTLLTSNHLEFLKKSFDSIRNQNSSDLIKYTIIIIVNTLDQNYILRVKEEFNNKCKVVITESNGLPGKGHNSCIQYFKDHDEYDYLIPIDGDDFVYPWFLESLLKYIKHPYNPDILLLPYSDFISSQEPNSHFTKIDNYYWSFGLDEFNLLNSYYNFKLSPFTHDLTKVNTMGRFLLISRNALNAKFSFSEENFLDDLKPTLEVFEYSILYPETFKLYILDDINLFIYNKLNSNSSSINYLNQLKQDFSKIQETFNELIKDNFLAIRDYDLKKIKVLKNQYDKTYFNNKYNFIVNLIKTFN